MCKKSETGVDGFNFTAFSNHKNTKSCFYCVNFTVLRGIVYIYNKSCERWGKNWAEWNCFLLLNHLLIVRNYFYFEMSQVFNIFNFIFSKIQYRDERF